MSDIVSNMNGLQFGVVKKITGDTNNLNRISVNLNYNNNNMEIKDVPVLTDCAGNNWGKVVLPSVGDVVIVGFINGNIETPIVMGSIPTSKRKPPYNIKNSSNYIKYYKTKSGIEFEINEESKDSSVKIKSKNGNTITLNDSSNKQILEVKSKDTKTSLKIDLKKSSIEIKSQNITFDALKSISMKAGDSSVELKNGKGMTLKSPAGKFNANVNSVVIDAKTSATLKSKATTTVQGSMANIKANGVTQVKGSMVKIG